MSEQERVRTLQLPEELVVRVEDRLPRTEWDDPEAYVSHVLEEVLFHVKSETDDEFESVDDSDVEERLKSLGYLNE